MRTPATPQLQSTIWIELASNDFSHAVNRKQSRFLTNSLRRGLSSLFGLFGASSAQDIRHRVVALVAGVLVNLIAGLLRDREFHGPGSCERLRIGHRDCVLDRAVAHARESFHQTQIFAVLESRSVRANADSPTNEIGGLNDERVALPVPARVAHICAQTGG